LIDEMKYSRDLVFVERGFIKKAMYSRGHWRVTY
jgi:hypothetical protein